MYQMLRCLENQHKPASIIKPNSIYNFNSNLIQKMVDSQKTRKAEAKIVN